MGDLLQIRALIPQVDDEVLEAFLVAFQGRSLGIRHKDHRIGSAQHQLAGGIVEDLARHRIELDAGLHAPDGAQFDGQEIEEEGAVRLGGQGQHLAAPIAGQRVVDMLEVGRLAAEARAVVDDLGRQLLGRSIEKHHASPSCRLGRLLPQPSSVKEEPGWDPAEDALHFRPNHHP